MVCDLVIDPNSGVTEEGPKYRRNPMLRLLAGQSNTKRKGDSSEEAPRLQRNEKGNRLWPSLLERVPRLDDKDKVAT